MRIRKLELQGFKSFVDRQVFHFGDGIAGVVGPNGCGKSNIVDAIRWCIGEQSAKSLRGSAMQDVIFNGSAVRKPVGMAEVSITFITTDEPFPGEYARCEEMQIARRLYRDGTSEYLINQAKVRRKDIVDFFMDTGIGNKLYSFIQQGQIGEIVSAKPEERRGMLEEAAGISKYKMRREEAEQKLGETAQNLARATDVSEEMGRRLKALERQVERASRFRRARARVRQGELFLGLVKLSGLTTEQRELTGELRLAKGEADRLGHELERADGELKLRRDEIAVMNAVVNTLRDQLSELEAQRRERESARHYHLRERDELRARLGVLAHDLDDAARVKEQASLEADAAEDELSETTAAVDRLEQTLSEATAVAEDRGRRLVAIRAKVEEHKRVVMDQITGLARRRATLGAARQRREEQDERLQRFRGDRVGAESDTSGLREAVMAAEGAVGEREDALDEAKRRQQALQGQQAVADKALATAKVEQRQREEVATRAERELAKLEAQLQSLEDLQRSHSGVEGGARQVMKAVQTLGTLAEHLDVPEALEATLTAALGAALDHVLVADEATLLAGAKAAAGAGRTGLVVVNTSAPAPEGLAAQVGGSAEGRAALGVLLGATETAPDLATALLQHAERGARVITPQGEVVLPNGVVMVGRESSGAGEAILKRRRRVAELHEERTRQLSHVERLRAEVELADGAVEDAEHALRAARQAIEGFAPRVREAELAVSEARLAVRERTRELTAQEQRSAQLAGEEARQLAAIQKLDVEITQTVEAISREEERQHEIEEQLKHAQAELVRLETETAEARDALSRAKIEQSSARERLILLRKALDGARARSEEARRRLDRGEAENARCTERLEALEREQLTIEDDIKTAAESQGEVAQKLDVERKRLARERETLDRQEDALRGLRQAAEHAQTRASRAELRRQEVTLAIESLRDQLEGRYNVSLPTMLDQLDRDAALVLHAEEGVAHASPTRISLPDPPPDLRVTPELMEDGDAISRWVTELERLKGEIDKLGEVNLAAIEEYDEVAERYEWLEKQRADLEESVDSIRKTIARINRTCRERFRETFDRVTEHFRDIYPRLSGGGQARLALTNEEDLLETGVEIFVQPPGKRLQNLSLLSGGEKALCAIALIFALFRVKPSPFCVLDEVDAPLDEGNGARYNDMLREMCDLTQFIVITHNKKTMECADTLYGVTMPDPGVSRLVTVKVS